MKKLGLALAALLASAATALAEEGGPPGFTMARTGGVHDFDYFEGAWTTAQHRLKDRTPGAVADWDDFPGTLCMTRYLGGAATVDELYFPTRKTAGLTLRLFDSERRQWSIYWAGATGKLDPIPVVGGFDGSRGEFYAEDTFEGRPIKVRYLWTILDPDHARWEQAFSFDDKTWATNWTADFTRGDPAMLCARGQPKR